MRDKKYRAWNSIKKEFIYSDKVAGGMWRFFKLLEDRGIRHYETHDYIGKDKNGKEIYEEDIVLIAGKFRGKVFNRLGCWFVENGKELGYYPQYDIEVIGNIYEHGDLLKGEQ